MRSSPPCLLLYLHTRVHHVSHVLQLLLQRLHRHQQGIGALTGQVHRAQDATGSSTLDGTRLTRGE